MKELRKLVLLVGLTFAAPCSHAQFGRSYTDSLKNILKQQVGDTNRVWTLVKLVNAVYYESPKEGMQYADEALQLSQTLNWQKGMALSYRVKGGVYYIQSDYLRALDYLQKGLKANGPSGSKVYESSVLFNIGVIHDELKEHRLALKFYEKYLHIAKALKMEYEEALAYCNIANAYNDLDDLSTALQYYKKSIDIAEKTGNTRIVAHSLCSMGVLYRKQGDYPTALACYKKSLAGPEKSESGNLKSPILNGIALVYVQLQQYDKAEKYSKEALRIATKLNALQWQTEALEALSTIYEKQNETGKALVQYKQFIVFRDSLSNSDKKQAITRKEMQFEQEKREAVLNVQHTAELKQQQTERNAALGGGGLLLLASAAGFVLYKRKREADEQIKEAELKAEIADTETKALRAQMNPHFIFNSLNSISDYVVKNDTKTADYYLTKFAKLMRLILENSEKKQVILADDLQALELYMQLEALRMQHRFTYEIRVDEDLDPDETLIPPLLLQPFVENSIWHGLAWKEGVGKITIHIRRDGDMINCVVEDDGVGRQRAEAAKIGAEAVERKSLGMKITNARIALLNQQKPPDGPGDASTVTLSDLAEGTRVEVKLPLVLSF